MTDLRKTVQGAMVLQLSDPNAPAVEAAQEVNGERERQV
jgi:hypothetical protein